MNALSYLPGTRSANPGLLSRFLPPIEDGTVSAWLSARIPPGSWLLDPFGASPRLVLEAARLGYRVIVAANNPVIRFLIEIASAAPREADFNAALAELAATRKSDERLETHLQSLYLTACEKCETQIQARAFLWNRGEEAPYARVYECPQCGDNGERPVTPADVERAAQLTRSASLHRARVLERVAPLGHADREYAEEALQVYLPRALYALATLINRVDGMEATPERKRLITALVLAAFDAGTSLWAADRPRPRQLSPSNQFRERNIWMALERAVGLWSETSSPVPCVAWPAEVPESGGICLFDGRLRELAPSMGAERPIAAVITAVPRPNQAFWTLSALWTGWLWGHEAADPFKMGLRRRRYDWAWNATALAAAFGHLGGLLPQETPILALLAEPEPAYTASTFTAADASGFELTGIALRSELDPMQTAWVRRSSDQAPGPRTLEAVRHAIESHLQERGEPAPYLHIHAAAMTALASAHALNDTGEELDESLRQSNALVESALIGDARFAHYGPGEGVETGFWGLRHYDLSIDSLADRVEIAAVHFLQKNPDRIFLEIEGSLYEQFPGLLTPSKGLIYNVLYSYAHRLGAAWRLRDEDMPAGRREDLKRMAALVESVGHRLGYETRKEDGILVWQQAGVTERVFHLIASALVGRVLRTNTHPAEKCVIVLPGGRASLAAYKQQRDPALAESMREWRLLKFRLLRSLAAIPVLNRQSFDEQISSDPVEQARGQLMMF
ncbi:MAG: hypothetical protein ACM3QS_15485 [Bacteroidota bacterium]